MTLSKNINLNRISLHAKEQVTLSSEVQVFIKSASEPKSILRRYKNTVNIVTLNVRTLNIINYAPGFTASAAEWNTDIICVQEHR